jgi:hypothetical protein
MEMLKIDYPISICLKEPQLKIFGIKEWGIYISMGSTPYPHTGSQMAC